MGGQAFPWDPGTYLHFNDFRERPFFDLTARIGAAAPARVVDLGCGPGNLTATLARRWPAAQVAGLDGSAEMIAAARETHGSHSPGGPGLHFGVADIAGWEPGMNTIESAPAGPAPAGPAPAGPAPAGPAPAGPTPAGPAPAGPAPAGPAPDVVVSNAALQWVPQHRTLMSGWLAALHPGAWLGVQVPGNFTAPSHVIMRELAASARWCKQLDGVLRHDDAMGEPAEYQELFLRAGARVEVWETTYLHLLQGREPVLDWVRGTGLRPVLAALGPDEGQKFGKEYAALAAQAYPPGPHGTIFSFRRIFMVGEKQ